MKSLRKASDFLITRSYGVRGILKKGGCRGMISKCLLSFYEFQINFLLQNGIQNNKITL
ncbi:hypothetical protein HMPREF1430_00103 [Helicobacter pylori GAM96Ai]|nr:hypothetical protein HMPREF1430_00103 [Helicobacter pylori GAM96Ai]